MSAFLTAIEAFVDAVRSETAWVEELNDRSQAVVKRYPTATPGEIEDSLHRLASLFPDVPLVALPHVAITCGSLVERGGDPEIAGPALLERLTRVNETATDCYRRYRALAEADAELVEEWRAQATEDADEGADVEELTAAAVVAERIASHGWQELAARFGQSVFEAHPASVLGHMCEEFFRLGLIAHLSRSKPLRAAARSRPEPLRQTLEADEAAGSHRSFLATLLQVLDDEPLLVLHAEERRGFEVRISGIADNFQLHTLLAGAVIGSPAEGLVTGEKPSERAVAECRDSAVGPGGGDNVTGAFNLWNWSGLRPDGLLPLGQQGSEHWIWNEGCPAEIVPFEGRRVVLPGSPPYVRYWRAGRQFDGMAGELTVERRLSGAEVSEWLDRLARAANL